VAIDLQKVEGLLANAVEFAILVQNNGVAETVAELCAHDCRCKVFGISVLDGFHGSKAGHTTACNQIRVKTIEARVLSRRVGVNKQDRERRFDWKVLHQFGGFAFGRVCVGTTRAGIAHAGDIGVHSRPMISKANAVEGAVSIEVAANGIRMKGDEYDVVKFQWDQLEASIR
jgi:hypothetical protein